MDLDYEPEKKVEETKPNNNGNLFDLLDEPIPDKNHKPVNPNDYGTLDLLGTNNANIPEPSGNGITLNVNEFKTDAVQFL